MSLVRSARSFGNGKIYFLNGHNENYGLSTSIFTKNARGNLCATESSSTNSNDAKYLLESPSPSEELLNTSPSGVLENPFHQRHSPSCQLSREYNVCHVSYDSEDFVNQSPDSLEYSDGRVTLKLKELERVLFDDNDADGDDEFSHGQSMDVDGEWVNQIRTMLLQDKESTSSNSNISSSCSNKEISVTALQTPKQMLFSCAAAIQDGNLEQASLRLF